MKFLVDNQLPLALSRYLQKRGFDCEHVFDVDLAESSDAGICAYAQAQDRIIISKDEDFFYLASQPGSNVRLLWVRLGNCRTMSLLETFNRLWPDIESWLNSDDPVVEIR